MFEDSDTHLYPQQDVLALPDVDYWRVTDIDTPRHPVYANIKSILQEFFANKTLQRETSINHVPGGEQPSSGSWVAQQPESSHLARQHTGSLSFSESSIYYSTQSHRSSTHAAEQD